MSKVKKIKAAVSIILILTMLWLNVSVDFNVLFRKGEKNGHFIQAGVHDSYASSAAWVNVGSWSWYRAAVDPNGNWGISTVDPVFNISENFNTVTVYCWGWNEIASPDISNTSNISTYRLHTWGIDDYGDYVSEDLITIFDYNKTTAVFSDVSFPNNSEAEPCGLPKTLSNDDGSTSISLHARYGETLNIVLDVLDNIPTINVDTSVSSAQSDKNTLSLSGTVYDADVGDILTTYYRIDGSTGQAGTQFGSTITSNSSNQQFVSRSINVGGVSEGVHTLYIWVQDHKGGKSAETAITLEIDNSVPVPIVHAPMLIAVGASGDDGYVSGRGDNYYSISPYGYNCNSSIGVARQYYSTNDPETDELFEDYYVTNGLLRFDTSAIPDDAVITSAKLKLTPCGSGSSDGYNLTVEYYNFSTITTSCFNKDAGTDANAGIPLSDFVPNVQKEIPLNNLGNIVKNGYTGFRLNINNFGWTIAFYSYDSGTSLQTPILEVTYNSAPLIAINTPAQNAVFSEADTAYIPRISVSDANNDTLTCKYYIDSETTARDTKTASNTITAQTVSFNPLDMSTLAEGGHTVKYEVSDGVTAPVISSVSFTVDKSAPVLGTVSVTSSVNSATVSGTAADSIPGLDAYPYRYTIGSNSTSWLSSTTYTQSNLAPNTQYPVTFEARDAKNHIASSTQYIYTKAAVPSLTVSNATSYTLDVSTTDNNPTSTQYVISVNSGSQYVTPEGTLTSSPVWLTLTNKTITVKGLNPSTTYSFQAKARNGENIETAVSSAASGTTLIKPPVSPANLIATATDSQITVSWDDADTATGYEIQADSDIVNVGTSTTYTHTSLSPGTPHTYQVRARNAGGAGDWSTQITKSTLPSSPDIPVNLSTVSQSTSITVTWNNVPGATGYDIEVDGVLVNNGPNTNYVHSSLTPGTHHSYRVRSINPGGKSGWSAPVSATTTQVSSPVPANLTATPSQNQINLTWDAVDGASGYDIEVDGVSIDNNTNTSYTHTNLAPGSQHMYRVRSKKSGVLSDWSSAVISAALTDVFGTPSNLKANADDTSVALSWSAVTDATGYDVEADGAAIDSGTDTTAIISGLQPNSSHTYRVRARSGSETSEWSQPVQVLTYALPTPVILNSSSSETTVSIAWDSTTSAALAYELEADGTVIQGIQGNTYTCSGLLPNTQHIFRVRSINASGTSNWSIPLTKSTMFSGVTVPSGLFAMMKSTSATIAWQPMNGAISYDIDVDGTVAENIAETKYIHTGLQPGSQHIYRVRARNETGSSDWSAAITVLTIPEGPAVPSNITASSTISKILVSWDPVSGADEYEIEVDGVIVANGTGTSYLQSSLAPDTQHHYRVRSKSPAGYSAWSDFISANTKSSTMTYTVDCLTGEELNLVFSAASIQDIGQYTFTVTYNPDELEAVDLCGSTSRIDLAAGNIIGTDVQIVQFAPGTIVFKKTGSAQSYEIWSGIVNTVRFKSKFDGQADVTYSFQ